MLVIINSFLKLLRLLIVLISLSYFYGLLWFIFCDIRLQLDTRTESEVIAEEEPNFLVHFNFVDKDMYYITNTLTYYAFTTLSTVGLGDYHPRANIERIIISFLMMIGMVITSKIINLFVETV